MRAKVKYAVIYRHREEYPVLAMCRFFAVSRSGYYGYVKRMNQPEKDAALAETIRKQQTKCFHTYGYRRMWQWLKGSKGIYHNPKTILRVMKKYGNRDFHAETPNCKWVTDISYIHTGQGVLYLSMIRDLYDNSIVAYKTGTEQSVNLVLDTIHLAIRREKKKVAAELQLHSDQGFQYTSQAYFNRMTMQWQKISFPFSKQSASTATNRLPFLKPKR